MKIQGCCTLILSLLLSGCHMFTEERSVQAINGDSVPLIKPNAKIHQEDPAPTVVHDTTTRNGDLIKIEEFHPRGEKRSDLKISIRNEMSGLNVVQDVNPVQQILLGDLNQNGFDEVYIITSSFDNSRYGQVFAYECTDHKTLSRIGIPVLEKADLQKGGNFEGYHGDDKFQLEAQHLVRSYPLRENENSRIYLYYGLTKNNIGDTLVLRQRKQN
ncbi:MAG: hypothetical protein EAZ62_02645 [Sphingobacteriia bacterium]|nr:MAG: hypothetical protein EAZ62_02645 [Sphingobacteriia bacterium]